MGADIQSLALAPPSGLIMFFFKQFHILHTLLFFSVFIFNFNIKALVVHSLKQYLFIYLY